jgi:hypothetical protein
MLAEPLIVCVIEGEPLCVCVWDALTEELWVSLGLRDAEAVCVSDAVDDALGVPDELVVCVSLGLPDSL